VGKNKAPNMAAMRFTFTAVERMNIAILKLFLWMFDPFSKFIFQQPAAASAEVSAATAAGDICPGKTIGGTREGACRVVCFRLMRK
jgi:hypothetical protein